MDSVLVSGTIDGNRRGKKKCSCGNGGAFANESGNPGHGDLADSNGAGHGYWIAGVYDGEVQTQKQICGNLFYSWNRNGFEQR